MSGASFAVAVGATDILVANNKSTLTLDVDFTCGTITTSNTYGGTQGGGFAVSTASRNVTANVLAGNTPCITMGAGTYTLTVAGSVTGGSAGGAYGVYNASTASAALIISKGSNDAVIGGSNAGAYGISVNSGAAVTITGNVKGVTDYGVYITSSSSVSITGNVTGGTSGGVNGVFSSVASATITITGIVKGGTATGTYGVFNAGIITITGDVQAGTGANSYGLYNQQTNLVTYPVIIQSGNIINNIHSAATLGPILYNPGAGNYIEYPKSPSGVNDFGVGTAARPVSGQIFPRGV
jgi:hypothetical protein